MQQMGLSDLLLYTAYGFYLDDIIVYDEMKEEFLQYLKLVFQRLEKFNITLNPEKVQIGLSSIEYVGRAIDQVGLSFSKEKIEKVLNSPLPTTKKQLKSFLGLCVQLKTMYQILVHWHDLFIAISQITLKMRVIIRLDGLLRPSRYLRKWRRQ